MTTTHLHKTLFVWCVSILFLGFTSAQRHHDTDTDTIVSFGIVTDVHYADVPPLGNRIFRDSLPKMQDALRSITNANASFVIELGDFKDTDTTYWECNKNPSPGCINLTVGYLQHIESVFQKGFDGPHFHVLGNHDVDILNQSTVLANEVNNGVEIDTGTLGAYSWQWPPHTSRPPLRFIVLNGDYTNADVPWSDLDLPFPGESWDKANIPTFQLTWLAEQLESAVAFNQKVVVFVHNRLDGGPGGPVNCSNATKCGQLNNRAWVDDCTLENAAVVRDVLEAHSGLVLATFSGHDHVPHPPFSQERVGKPIYWTHAGMVEGYHNNSNAYSVVEIESDCTIVVRGFANATSARILGPHGCRIEV